MPSPISDKADSKKLYYALLQSISLLRFFIYIDFRHGIKRGKKYAEVFATDFSWAQAYPMKMKSDAHEALSMWYQRTGVLDKMITDGSKLQILGNFQNKCLEARCWLKKMEPHSPWKNSVERSIQ